MKGKRFYGIRSRFISLILAALWLAAPVVVTAQTIQFDVPAQPLAAALDQFARQAGLQLAFSPDLAKGKTSTAISGMLEVRQALLELLRGTGLQGAISGSTLTVERSPEKDAQLPEVEVEGEPTVQETTAWSPVEGYVATRSATGTKTDALIVEIPRSLSVVSAGQIEEQSAANLDEVLRYTAGIASEYRGIDRSRTDLIIRGFQGGEFVLTDGMRAGNAGYGSYDVDPYGLERVEVLRGPASVMYGASSPGGIVNVVSKRPTEERFAEIELEAGSYSQVGGRFDLGGAINDNENLLARFTGVVQDGDSQIDFTKESRVFLAPALTWKDGDGTSLTLLAKYQLDKGPWATFFPAVGTALPNPNGQIPTNRQIGEPDYPNGFEREFYTLGYVLESAFADNWLLRHGLRFNHFTFEGRDASGWGFDPALNDDRTVLRGAWYGREKGDSLVTDTNLQRTLSLGATEHTVLIGIDYKATSIASTYGEASPDPSWNLDLFNPVYGVAIFPSPDEILLNSGYLDQDQDQSQLGFYVQDQIKIGRWALTLGGRYDDARSKTTDNLGGTTTYDSDHAFTTQVGVAYLFDNGLAPYASYAESFEPLSGTDALGQAFEPTTGTQYEAGIKYQPPDTRSLFTFSLFEITQQNVLTRDLVDPNFSTQTGEVRSRGAEVEAKVNLSQDLYVTAAYTRIDAKITRSNDDDQGNRLGQTPESMASLWAYYRLPGAFLNGLAISAGVRHIGDSLDFANEIEVPSYTLFDFGMRYDLKGQWNGMSLMLNAKNLADKVYVASCEGEFWCIYGPRRVVTAGVKYRW